jgi:hypothetical protein
VKKNFVFYPLLIIIIFFGGAGMAGEMYPVGASEYSFIYQILDRFDIERQTEHLERMVAPIKNEHDFLTFPAQGFNLALEDNNARMFAILGENIRSAKYSKSTFHESIRGGMTATPIKNISIYINFLLDEELDDNPDYTGKKWRGFAGEIENAFINYNNSSLNIIAGRFGSYWGAEGESIIFSETARPMDALSVRYRWGRIRYSYQLGKLNRVISPDENEEGFENRYFAGHRLDIMFSKDLYLGLYETVIFGGPGRSLELAYMNPFLFYHAYQLNENFNDNTFLGMDLTYYIRNRHKLFMQFVIDDFQIDDEVRGDNEPNEIGFKLGIHSVDFLGKFELKAEYLAITNRTFNQVYTRNRYLNRGALIGHEFGPDGDRLKLTITRWIDYKKRIGIDIVYQRKGQGRVDDEWTRPWMDVENYAEPFPTGIVEKTFNPALDFTGFMSEYVFVSARAGIRFVDNFEHIDDESRTIPYLNLKFSLLFSTDLNLQ